MTAARPGLNILFAASEAAPFAKTGGLGEVVGDLPRYLRALGHDVRVLLPRYYTIDPERYGLTMLPGTLVVPMGIVGTMYCGVCEGRLPGSDVPVYFLEHEGLYGRDGIYGIENVSFLDNDNRYIFLSRAALELPKMLGWKPDIVHAHDWHTAAVPVFLNTLYRTDPLVGNAASILTIHNMQYQGSFYPGLMDVLGIGWEHFTFLELEKDDQVNLLKGGMYHATLLNTVSQGYAREIQTPAYGWGLEGVVRERADDLWGILNGVDYHEWDPAIDRYIPANYSADDLSGKAVCKRALQRRFGLPERDDLPVFGVVSRMVPQKGTDLLAEAIHRLIGLELQLVIVGNGEPWAHFFFGGMAHRHPDRVGCHIGYDNALAHLVEAGADFFLMPSAFEPCGLNQMYSLAYGTPPVVRATGGLDDSVENFNEATGSGDGFKFWNHTASALYDTVGWAVWTWYNNPQGLAALRRNGMAKRFTWEEAARKYDELYRAALQRRLGG
ncbi:glycogen synthase [Trichlorobacter ammonificans]|uniref:Glycogen synthase n=1 Tax=Trichlorobacter ammonificans TaxID=2916410 RepID=A0ABM9DAU0_9BACT|nr:glycogen/starch synthase [Trichlorobacter ammonificans]CAH2032295.1 Glycogen synthase 1 [Trichlorobacter ammonificans]